MIVNRKNGNRTTKKYSHFERNTQKRTKKAIRETNSSTDEDGIEALCDDEIDDLEQPHEQNEKCIFCAGYGRDREGSVSVPMVYAADGKVQKIIPAIYVLRNARKSKPSSSQGLVYFSIHS